MSMNQVKKLGRLAWHEIPAGLAHAARDPVCGMLLAQSALRFTYEGRSFPFCSFPCASRFREDPERFLRAAASTNDEGDGVTGNQA